MSINPRGQTTGTDSGRHGFVRDSDGTITTFDAGPIGTFPQSINPSGEITGYYADLSLMDHGFLRDHDGNITTFNVGLNNPTFPTSINEKDVITGFYSDSSSMTHGFVRGKGGKITTFDAGPFDTMATSINAIGEITGYFFGANKLAQGFMRARKAISLHLKLWARVAPPSARARFLKVSTRAARSRVSTLMQLGRTTAFCVYLIMNKESKDNR